MRLSNVQYYFKSRDDVLTAMVTRYFDDCAEVVKRLTAENAAATQRERVHFLVCAGLAHGQDVSEMCRAFREIWAISSRNSVIDQCLAQYYRRFADTLARSALNGDADPATSSRLKALLVPYFEGYSVTAPALDLTPDAAADMLTDLALSILNAQDSP
ncbi:MAG: hypothetical protein AAGB05_11375 [Pseudomonadota bacterium]